MRRMLNPQHSRGAVARPAIRTLLVFLMVAAGFFVLPSQAWASATNCANGLNPATCIHVQGSGNRVDRVSVGVRLNSRQGTTGHWYVWGVNRPYNTSEQTLWNSSYFGQIVWASFDVTDSRVRGNYPDGRQICAEFYRHPGFEGRGAACVTIHR